MGNTKRAEEKALDRQIGARIRRRRREVGLGPDALGAFVGVTLQQIRKYETGEDRVSASRLYRFAEVLRVPLTDFLADENAGRSGPEIERDRQAAESDELANCYFQIRDPKLRALLIQIAKQMKRL